MPDQSERHPTSRLVIGIAGPIGSGKTSVGRYLNSAFGFQYVRYSQVLADWFAEDSEVRGHLQEVGWKVMAGGMQAELNRRVIARISHDLDAAVDGLRHPLDHELLTQAFSSSFHLVYTEASIDVRWQRLQGRGRYTRRQAFDTADAHPVEQQIAVLRAKADLVIRNEGSLEGLYAAVDGAVRRFREESMA